MISNRLFRPDGTIVSYEQLAAEAGDRFKDIVTEPNFIKVSAAVQIAVNRLADDLSAGRLDAYLPQEGGAPAVAHTVPTPTPQPT